MCAGCKKLTDCATGHLCIASFCVPHELINIGEQLDPNGFVDDGQGQSAASSKGR